MRVAALTFTALLTALALAPSGGASCAAGVEYKGRFYLQWGVKTPVSRGAALRGGKIPGCNDTGGSHESGTPIRLERVRGIAPRVAVARPGERDTVYVGPGFFPILRGHPLHRTFFSAAEDRSARPHDCDHPATVRGRVTFQPGPNDFFPVHTGNHDTYIALSAGTHFTGHTVAGLPYIAEGDRIVARTHRCAVRDGHGRVASRVRVIH